MKKHFVLTFAFLLALGLGGSVALAQVSDVADESPSPLVSESPDSTETPLAAETPDFVIEVDQTNTIDPVWVFLAGALIGAALLSLSEVSAVTYLKKHGKGRKK